MVVFPHFLSVPNPICALTLCARALSHRPCCDREELFFCAMFCFPTNVEARCWCVVVIIFLHNGKRVKGNKSRREKYVVCGVRFLRASVFMRGGRFHARVSTQSIIIIILVVSFHPHKQPRRDETRAYLDLLFSSVITFFIVFLVYRSREASLFHPYLPPPPPPKKNSFCQTRPIFPPLVKKRILCLGCKICKDFFFRFSLGRWMNVRFGGGGGGGVSCTKQKMSP